jgi:methylenetetrahydrofolate dehydrogenase (NADP+)/methenyltetrahydrofolate cyclohydrolase
MAITHSKTKDLPAVCRRADLLVAAIGRPEMVRGDWIKPEATVIDVGTTVCPAREEKLGLSATSLTRKPCKSQAPSRRYLVESAR